MDPDPSTPTPKPPRGLPLWTALVALAVLTVLFLGALGAVLYYTRSESAKSQRRHAELQAELEKNKVDQARAVEQERITQARTRQTEVLNVARNATNILERLMHQTAAFSAAANALKTSEAGRTVALHPDLVAQARRLYDVCLPALPTTADMVAKLEAARRIEQQLVANLGTTYEPTTDLTVTAQNGAAWGEQQMAKVKEAQILMAALVEESKIKVTAAPLAPAAPSLSAALDQQAQAEAALRQRLILERTTPAKTEAAVTVGDAEAKQILEKARLEATNLLMQAAAAAAEQQRQLDLQKASNKLETTKTSVATKQIDDEARKLEAREKASRPEIKTKLASFITPGYWQVTGPPSFDMKPLSFNQINAYGALAQSKDGLLKLYHITVDKDDKVRPRSKLKQHWYDRPEDHEKMKEIQALLIELGPVLVELKMLEP